MEQKEFALRLSQLRINKGVSAREMSLSIGQSCGYINNIENGESFPSMTVFFYICEYLEISPKDFFDTENLDPKRTDKLLYAARGLDGKQLDNLIELAKGLKR